MCITRLSPLPSTTTCKSAQAQGLFVLSLFRDTLPPEILAEIFKSGSAGNPRFLKNASQVCAQWRAAALDPDLWTDISVAFFMRDVVRWTSLCLERSKSCLFDVSLQVPDETTNLELITELMLLFVRHAQRLRRLYITGATAGVRINPAEAFALLENAQRAPHLSVLELVWDNPSQAIDMAPPRDGILIYTPALTSLRLHGVPSPVPFVGLRSLDIQGLRTSYADFRDMVTASPLLTTLILPKLRLLTDTKATSHTLPPIAIPSLKSLALSFANPPPSEQFNPCHNLLSLLQIPNVEYLELVGGIMPDLAESLQKPGAFGKLRTLRLVGMTFVARRGSGEVDNALYIRELSSIEELHLIQSYAEYLLPLSAPEDKIHSRSSASASGRPRRLSITFRNEASLVAMRHKMLPIGLYIGSIHQPVPEVTHCDVFPNLRCIALDTLMASDAVWLYKLLGERPGVTSVKLSALAERHFVQSLGTGPDGSLHRLPWRTDSMDFVQRTPVDASKLLRERVQVSVQNIGAHGLIPWQGP
ncbi:hypothetical protein MKEN_01219500 [Mycena kentingensis (nom. inval.)]|nr:hypothetical protein MKEN_01219500 [Mycena kentingensis (nom. inval.)]